MEQTDDVTLQEGAQPAEAGTKPQGGGNRNDEKVTITRAEFERINRELKETRESERAWASLARGPQQQAQPQDEEEVIETDDLLPATGSEAVDEAILQNPEKWVEAVSKGPGAIKTLIKSMGLVSAAEVAEIARKVAARAISYERGKMSTDAALVRDFPELTDKKSPLFKETAKELQAMVNLDPKLKNSPGALLAAAKVAKATLDAAEAGKRASRRRNDDDEDDDRYDRYGDRDDRDDDDREEQDRRRRSDSQDTTRNRGRDRSGDDDMLGDQARRVIAEMGITAEEFRESEKQTRGMRPRGRR
jgi:hypothetical protein